MEEKKTKIGMLIGGLSLILFGLALSLFFEKIIFYGFEKVRSLMYLLLLRYYDFCIAKGIIILNIITSESGIRNLF